MDTDAAYLDYAAATPLDPQVLEAMMPYLTDCFYNPSAPYALAREAKDAYEAARQSVAHLMGARPAAVTFTAGATEANNLALAAVDGGVVASAIEHDSVLAGAKARGCTLVGVDEQGLVDPGDVAQAIGPDTALVSISLANGEVGSVQPLREIAAVVAAERQRRLEAGEARPILLHTDASQAATTCALNVSSLGADLVTVSAAKMYGPKQVGCLWAADGIALRPLVLGGGQEGGVRSGTENVAGVVGFAKAFELASASRKQEAKRLAKLRDSLQRQLVSQLPNAIVVGPRKNRDRLSGLLNIAFNGLEARRLVILLERKGVSVGTGSACAASKMRVSHVLQALGLDQETAQGSLRITLGRPTTEAEIDYAARTIVQVVREEGQRVGVTV